MAQLEKVQPVFIGKSQQPEDGYGFTAGRIWIWNFLELLRPVLIIT
jgi:hypothetical protein